MTAADKLRELLATRPAMPNVEELTRWWRTSAELVPQLLCDLEAMDCDLVAERAAHRRTQDERADLRVELDRERIQHRANVEGFESALAQERHEKDILEQCDQEIRQERDRMLLVYSTAVKWGQAREASRAGWLEQLQHDVDYALSREAERERAEAGHA